MTHADKLKIFWTAIESYLEFEIDAKQHKAVSYGRDFIQAQLGECSELAGHVMVGSSLFHLHDWREVGDNLVKVMRRRNIKITLDKHV